MVSGRRGADDSAPKERSLRSDGQRTSTVIAAAAVAQIAEQGLAGTTQRRVAKRAGVSLASVTYHFATLDDLFDAAFDHLIQESVAQLSDLKQSAEQGEITLPDAWNLVVRGDDGTMRPTVAASLELLVAATREPRLQPAARRLLDALNEFFLAWTTEPDPARSVLSLMLGLSLTEGASGRPLVPDDIGGILAAVAVTPDSQTCPSKSRSSAKRR